MSALENRYRRLLRWYPADHRRVHEEEMLGVLLAAGPDRPRPPVRDALNLVLGGLGIRLRRAPRAFARDDWHGAAALLSVLAPLFLLADAVRYVVWLSVHIPQVRFDIAHGYGLSYWADFFYAAPAHLLWVFVAVAALAGARRTAMAGTVAAIVVEFVRFFRLDDYAGGAAFAPILLGLITVAALAAGPEAARGRALLGRGGLTGIVVLLAVTVPYNSLMVRNLLGLDERVVRLGLLAAAALAAGWLARGAAGRRAVVVLAAPLYPLIVPFYPEIEGMPARYLVTMVAIPLTVGLAALVLVTLTERLVLRPVATLRHGRDG